MYRKTHRPISVAWHFWDIKNGPNFGFIKPKSEPSIVVNAGILLILYSYPR